MKTLYILTKQEKIQEFSDSIDNIINIINISKGTAYTKEFDDIKVVVDSDELGKNKQHISFLEKIDVKNFYILFHETTNYCQNWIEIQPKLNFIKRNHFTMGGTPYYDFFKAIVDENLTIDLINKHFPTKLESSLNFLHEIYNGKEDINTIDLTEKELEAFEDYKSDKSNESLAKLRDCLLENVLNEK